MFRALILKLQQLLISSPPQYLFYAGRVQVLNLVLFGLGNFWCSCILLPQHLRDHISRTSRQFFWGCSAGCRKMVYKSWDNICAPWAKGGFNVKNLTTWNQDHSIWLMNIGEHHPECLRGIIQTRDHCLAQLGSILQVKNMLQQCTVAGKFSIQHAYNALRTKYAVTECSKAIQRGFYLPRHRVLLQLASQNRLVTVDHLASRGLHMVNRCYLCQRNSESAAHLYFYCSYADEVLQAIKQWVGINTSDTSLQQLLSSANKRRIRRHWRIQWVQNSIAATVYSIWSERNLRIFENKCRSSLALIRDIQYTVSTILFVKIQDAFHEDILDNFLASRR
ncbi:uncharacterized protein LOC141617064 [Silene latifolia]|uniref:uncharacterized protein LOC141617064 n=1 Tax=Silene latifolia TaxID=37657 RepID=UPI003D78932B